MISPESMVPASEAVYLAYNASGPGHYDALVMQSHPEHGQDSTEANNSLDVSNFQSTLPTEKGVISTPRKPCRCGEKNKYQNKTRSSRSYKGRCKCINNYGTCMSTCNCCGSCQGARCSTRQKMHNIQKESLKIKACDAGKTIKNIT